MTKLKVIYQQWNAEQRTLYNPVLTALLDNGISSDTTLFERNVNTLCLTTHVSRWLMKAFINQVIMDTSIMQEKSSDSQLSHLPTEFPLLDSILGGGLCFMNIIELCGQSRSGQTEFISHLLVSYISHISNSNIHIFSTGSFGPKGMSDIFKKRDIDSTVLSQIEFLQLFSLNDLSLSLENLGALLATGTNNAGLVIIEDISAIDINWASNQIIQHSISKSDMNDTRKFEYYWNPMVDLRLYFSKIENKLSVEIMKSRQKISTRSCLIEVE
ncbi:hypothetical protein G6F57_009577 [Rhizopus arrhizus]|uniref:Uncharacterized protein n=1 Tax=Rhizopus oryzae TaxID=64495 RepID=A0A9P6X0Q0_RHIOR|nr:hypothetical protein G6F23_007839 [Rhizopus arrhizus]KAG1413706.1 hypothetical protein G6F58_007332 [Rhizopus delemar]KAG0756456.1 hypothetical protein G6F24_011138 [Rhizopus arrhizus]KAG0787819.1 hypothetical protein G6F22_007196 [Rhizopus arrhizus]KAG0791034.1 hypothetical protein G6F21_005375 [Rhizopus arrhizus]